MRAHVGEHLQPPIELADDRHRLPPDLGGGNAPTRKRRHHVGYRRPAKRGRQKVRNLG